MTTTPPAPKRSAYVYAVIDLSKPEDEQIVMVEMTRRAARDKVQWHKNADSLRIRRGRLFLYES